MSHFSSYKCIKNKFDRIMKRKFKQFYQYQQNKLLNTKKSMTYGIEIKVLAGNGYKYGGG